MFKHILFTFLLFIGSLTFVSCGTDEPESSDNTDPKTDAPVTNPDEQETDKQEKNEVTVYSDGSTSTGVPFRRVDDTTFWLNYLMYQITDGHINVVSHDCVELEHTLKGNVEIYSAITIDGTPYPVREIKHKLFYECTQLQKITIPNSIVNIGRGLFGGCTNLETVNLPKGLSIIPDNCFSSCTSLERLEIPSSVTEIGEFCFYYCINLEHLVFSENPPRIYPSYYDGDEYHYFYGYKWLLLTFGKEVWMTRDQAIYTIIPDPVKFAELLSEIYNKGYFRSFYRSHFSLDELSIVVPESALEAYKADPSMKQHKYKFEGFDPETFDFNSLLE